MNVLIDTNVVLDDILNRIPNATAARNISQFVETQQVEGYISASSLTDIYYIVTKNLNEDAARKVLRNLLVTFIIISVSGEDCQKAIDLPMSDFEDALVVVCADKSSLDYIVTNDKEFLADNNLLVPAISSADAVSRRLKTSYALTEEKNQSKTLSPTARSHICSRCHTVLRLNRQRRRSKI